jgi:predicted dithiol-disulfide oxidoreductase (DUF899 family)
LSEEEREGGNQQCSRGQDILNGAYNILDMTPNGRDEEGLPFTMAWVKLHDEYDGA